MRISDWSSDVCSSDLSPIFAISSNSPSAILAEALSASIRTARRGERVSVGMSSLRAGEAVLQGTTASLTRDRKSVVSGKSVSVRVDLGGGRLITQKIKKNQDNSSRKHNTRTTS